MKRIEYLLKPADAKLTPTQERAMLALLTHGTIEAAYVAARVSKVTMWRYLKLVEFQARYRAARRQLVETAIAQLQSDCTVAARVLREVAEDTQAPASARVAAAKTILDQSISAIELMDLQERVKALEELTPEPAKGQSKRWG